MFPMENQNKQYVLDDILQCLPLKTGVKIIGALGLVYGCIGIFFFFSMCIHYRQWQDQYKDKLDLYVYLHFIFFSIIAIFVCAVFVFWGVSTNEDIPFIIAMWSIIVHLSIIWSAIIGLFIYCSFVPSCFQNNGPEYVVVLCVVTTFYSMVWGYALWIINSYRFAL